MITRMLRHLTAHAGQPKPARMLLGDTGISLPLELPPTTAWISPCNTA